jgi:diphosphomevalonate decarboxylase
MPSPSSSTARRTSYHISDTILKRDFERIAMADSNQFHVIALDTDPPIFYMNDISRAIVAIVNEYNRLALPNTSARRAAYTFDAGPNAVIYTPSMDIVKDPLQITAVYFPQYAPFEDPFTLFPNGGLVGALVDA